MKIPGDMISGTIHKTKLNGDLIIVEYQSSVSVKVRFISTGYEMFARVVHVRNGSVRDPLHPSVFGVGYLGIGQRDVLSKVYCDWRNMIKRCYDEITLKKRPSYKNCTVTPEWHNFQNFSKWYEENHPNDGGKYHLDKDLLVVGNKVYSSNTCVFVPQWLNSFTLDRKSYRGTYPIGVSVDSRSKKFRARCNDEGSEFVIGYFSTPEEAYLAWRKYKLKIALDKKSEMDAIDLRIYPNVVQIINEAR